VTTKAIDAKPKDPTAELKTLIPKARTDAKAAAMVLQITRENGTFKQFVKGMDIAFQAEYSFIKSFAGDDELTKAMQMERLRIMREELAGNNPTPLEILLAERIALCWHHVHLCECVVAQNAGSMSLAQAAYHGKRLDSAHKRYLSSIKALAQVRKLQLPNVQVNIGEKQVNVGQVTGAP
jgi:hypothetical protein